MTEQTPTDLIRYPLAVNHYQWEVCNRDNKILASCDGKETAAEIVRVMNAAREREVAEQSASDKPATVAPGEPSEAAMWAAEKWYRPDTNKVILSELAEVIDAAFAAERAEAAALIASVVAENKNVECERDEANYWMHQLRADLDEAVGLLKDANKFVRIREADSFLARLSAKSQPPTGEVAGEVEMPEPAISDLADAAAEFIAGMGEPVDLEEVTIPRKEFKRAKKVIAEVATLRQQLAERDETIKRIKALL